jgi:hypothetical protein
MLLQISSNSAASGVFTGRDVIHSDTNNVNTPFISESDVTSALKKLKPKLTAGPDNIPAFLLKDCASVLAYPLQLVFNLALKTCKFPEIWKLSSISPIFKKGNRTQVKNYRPISLICNFSKVFESILYDTLFASVRNTISEFQHGFVSGRSTVTNLCSFTQFVAECFDARLIPTSLKLSTGWITAFCYANFGNLVSQNHCCNSSNLTLGAESNL